MRRTFVTGHPDGFQGKPSVGQPSAMYQAGYLLGRKERNAAYDPRDVRRGDRASVAPIAYMAGYLAVLGFLFWVAFHA